MPSPGGLARLVGGPSLNTKAVHWVSGQGTKGAASKCIKRGKNKSTFLSLSLSSFPSLQKSINQSFFKCQKKEQIPNHSDAKIQNNRFYFYFLQNKAPEWCGKRRRRRRGRSRRRSDRRVFNVWSASRYTHHLFHSILKRVL